MQEKTCTKCNTHFTLDQDDLSFYEKMQVPPPNVCPDCRFKMRAVWRNEISLYSGRSCVLCQKSTVSMYNPKSPYVIYCNSCYRSDAWDPRSYAQEYDLNRSFFDQLKELLIAVPKNALFSTTGYGQMVQSDFTNCCGGLKNCYMCFNTARSEDSAYCRGLTYSTETFDSYFCSKLDQCYEAVNTHTSTKVAHAKNSVNCVDSIFLLQCSGCVNCFGCINLRNKSYCWLNEQLPKDEYQKRFEEVMGNYQKMEDFRMKFEALSITLPHRDTNNLKVEDCIGDYLSESKNVKYSLEVGNGEDSRWNFASREIKDSNGVIGYGVKSELMLEVTSTGFTSNAIGCAACENSQNILHCMSCYSSDKNLIGCDSLRNAEYCILNKQYTKKDYEKLKAHIAKELTDLGVYGLMMPIELAPFAYNETIAQDNFPLTKEEALKLGFRWEDDIQMTTGKETLKPEQIADNIKDVSDSIISEILCCTECSRNYKITAQEFQFYKKMQLPIPRKCFYCRHQDRIKRRGPYKFYNRNCAHCQKAIVTNYAPERPEIVYCEQCYQQEVI